MNAEVSQISQIVAKKLGGSIHCWQSRTSCEMELVLPLQLLAEIQVAEHPETGTNHIRSNSTYSYGNMHDEVQGVQPLISLRRRIELLR